MNDFVFALVAFAASIVSGIVGFGTGLILISFGSFFYDIKETIVLANIFFIGVTVSRTMLFRRHIDWQLMGLVFLAGIPCILLGANLLIPVPEHLIRQILGVSIFFYLVNVVFEFTGNIRMNKAGIVAGGGLWGFLGGLVGDGNVVKAALFNHIGISKEVFVATMACTSLVGNIIKYFIYSKLDYESQRNPELILILLLLAVAGSWIGKQVLQRMATETFRRLVLVFLLFMACKLIIFG